MKFDDLDKKMRVFETAHDHCVLPEIFMVARIDGRNFTRLTKEIIGFEAPYDVKFRDYMVETIKHLMNCGFRIIYGYTQSDEISLLFHPEENAFNRKLRKYNSILSGEASAKFSLLLGCIASFDCRISQLPTMGLVADYFNWRCEDAHRNALNSHCYWQLRKEGESPQSAQKKLLNLGVSEKNELLFRRGINFNDIPSWQKRGVGLYRETCKKEGINNLTGESVTAIRKRIKVDYDIPMKEEYGNFILNLIQNSNKEDEN